MADAGRACHPYAARFVRLQPTGLILAGRKAFARSHRSVAGYFVHADFAAGPVRHEQALLIGRQRYAERTLAFARDGSQISLTSNLLDDSRGRIAEVDTAIDRIDNVRRLFGAARQYCDAAIFLRACNAAGLAGENAALMVEGAGFGAVAVLAIDRNCAALPFQNAVGRHIAEEQVTTTAEEGPRGGAVAPDDFFRLRDYDPLPCAK